MPSFFTKGKKNLRNQRLQEYNFNNMKKDDSAQSLEALKHSQSYSNLLDIYVSSTKRNIWLKFFLKLAFFLITMGALIAIVWFFYLAINFVFQSLDKFEDLNELSIEAILGMLTAVVPSITSLVVAFIKIPEIIAEYLFNIKEDSYMNSVIKNIQDYDKAMFAMEHKVEEALIQNKDQNPKNQDEDIEEPPNENAG